MKSRNFIFLTCKVGKWAKAKSRDFILNTKYSLKWKWNLQPILRVLKCFQRMYICNIYSILIPTEKTHVCLIDFVFFKYLFLSDWAYLILFLWTFFWLLKYYLYLIVKGTKFRWALTRKENWFSFFFSNVKFFLPKLPQSLLILCEIYILIGFETFVTSSDSQ